MKSAIFNSDFDRLAELVGEEWEIERDCGGVYQPLQSTGL